MGAKSGALRAAGESAKGWGSGIGDNAGVPDQLVSEGPIASVKFQGNQRPASM